MEALFRILKRPLVSVDENGRRYKRYQPILIGWKWLIVPRIELREIGEIDIGDVTARSFIGVRTALDEIAGSARAEIDSDLKAAAKRRAQRLSGEMEQITLGSDELPSAIVKKGRAAIQLTQRSLVESIGSLSQQHFEKALRRSLAQIMEYARQECGSAPSEKFAFPHGTRFVYYADPLTLYVIEESPRIRTVMWDREPCQLSFPYVVHMLYMRGDKFETSQVFFRNQPLQKDTDILCAPALPDVYNKHNAGDALRHKYWACFPGPVKKSGSPNDVARSALEVFWGSSFLTKNYHEPVRGQVIKMEFYLDAWMELTERDPNTILKVAWKETEYSPDILAADLVKRDKTSNLRESLSKLEKYVAEIGGRVAGSMREIVLERLTGTDATEAKILFEKKLQEALIDAKFSEKAEAVITDALMRSCEDSCAHKVVVIAARRAADNIATTVTSLADDAVEKIATELLGQQEEKMP